MNRYLKILLDIESKYEPRPPLYITLRFFYYLWNAILYSFNNLFNQRKSNSIDVLLYDSSARPEDYFWGLEPFLDSNNVSYIRIYSLRGSNKYNELMFYNFGSLIKALTFGILPTLNPIKILNMLTWNIMYFAYESLLEIYKPKVVVLNSVGTSHCNLFIRLAKARGAKVVVINHSYLFGAIMYGGSKIYPADDLDLLYIMSKSDRNLLSKYGYSPKKLVLMDKSPRELEYLYKPTFTFYVTSFYNSMDKFCRWVDEFASQYPNARFILKLHPLDKTNFCKVRSSNIKILLHGSLHPMDYISISDLIISGMSTVLHEAAVKGVEAYLFEPLIKLSEDLEMSKHLLASGEIKSIKDYNTLESILISKINNRPKISDEIKKLYSPIVELLK